ncbi:hypothetical protein L3Y34_002738 [Caenorhabditis briggsae]|uniref:Uncharacterized protein n=1 Tax=Caenorhabditis briggsae TaxID=6238 RepID=A0AAE9DH54_CAEBR|nr:hypothetical protein L3Y34_002738 [Caenorhabditis briggsae]
MPVEYDTFSRVAELSKKLKTGQDCNMTLIYLFIIDPPLEWVDMFGIKSDVASYQKFKATKVAATDLMMQIQLKEEEAASLESTVSKEEVCRNQKIEKQEQSVSTPPVPTPVPCHKFENKVSKSVTPADLGLDLSDSEDSDVEDETPKSQTADQSTGCYKSPSFPINGIAYQKPKADQKSLKAAAKNRYSGKKPNSEKCRKMARGIQYMTKETPQSVTFKLDDDLMKLVRMDAMKQKEEELKKLQAKENRAPHRKSKAY